MIEKNLNIISIVLNIISAILSIALNSAIVFVTVLIATVAFMMFKRFNSNDKYLFSNLRQKVTIDLQDNDGSRALYINESQLRALQNNISSHDLEMRAAGELNNINVNPGNVESSDWTGYSYKIKCSFRRPLKKGEVVDVRTTFNLIDSFNENQESVKVLPLYLPKLIEINIIFPPDRGYKSFKAFKCVGHEDIMLDLQPNESNIDNRARLSLTVDPADHQTAYKVTWEW